MLPLELLPMEVELFSALLELGVLVATVLFRDVSGRGVSCRGDSCRVELTRAGGLSSEAERFEDAATPINVGGALLLAAELVDDEVRAGFSPSVAVLRVVVFASATSIFGVALNDLSAGADSALGLVGIAEADFDEFESAGDLVTGIESGIGPSSSST